MREAGIQVNDTPKIHCTDPTVEDHSIYFERHDLRIPLSLHGIFSYFDTYLPTSEEVETIERVIQLTPDRWNPHSDVYSQNEASMLNAAGDISDKQDQLWLLISDLPDPMEDF